MRLRIVQLLALLSLTKMAAVESDAPKSTTDASVDDDDAWLYGDENKGERDPAESAVQTKPVLKEEEPVVSTGHNGVKRDDREEGEMSGEEGEARERDEEEDSDDDDVQVTIGDIKAWNVNEQPRNLFKSGATYQKTVAGTTTKPAVATKGLDIEAQGTINGIPVYEFDLDSIKNEDKPWRKPGADITDYFNYGFTEETWQLYCEKQRRLIALNEGTAPVPKIVTVHTASSAGHSDKDTLPVARRVLAPITKPAGQINVIGATAKDSRRPESEGDPIPVAGSGFPNRKFVVPPPGLPPTNLPPPHLPPLDYSLPPPGLPPPPGVPPPSLSVPPPGFPPVPDPYETYFAIPPPDRSVPPPGFEDRQPFSYSNTHPTFTSNSYTEASRPQPTHQWDAGSTFSDRSSERDWERERDRRDSVRRERSPHRSEEDFSRETQWRGHERDRERNRERERELDRSRDRDRDRERTERKRDRDSVRRSRSREREREPDRGSRDEDKHRSRRSDSRKHRDDSDNESRSSKHKSRRRRREKDEEGGDAAASEDASKTE